MLSFYEMFQIISSKDKRIEDRLTDGWAAEDQIINVLKTTVGRFDKPKGGHSIADKFDKIDGILTFPNRRVETVQIKARQNGNDVLVEVLKDYERNVPGRDMLTKAKIYVVRDMSGRIILIKTEQIKSYIKEMLKELEIKGFDESGWFANSFGKMKLNFGDFPARHKVVAYLPFSLFSNEIINGVPAIIPVVKAA